LSHAATKKHKRHNDFFNAVVPFVLLCGSYFFSAKLRDSAQPQAIQMATLPIIFVASWQSNQQQWGREKYEVINKDHKTEARRGFKQFADCRSREVSRAEHARNGEYHQGLDR